ncbi:MAG: DMT family transporter [Candidatus Eisenbacteria bacterium]|nr:DMT family transporter [Candidatus Eisenbacteria bacterium]
MARKKGTCVIIRSAHQRTEASETLTLIAPHLGEALSLLAALIWAASVVLFRMSGRSFAPFALNLFKNTIATLLFLATFAVLRENLFRPAPPLDYILLALSGVIGIAVADTVFFRSLNIVGAGPSQIVNLSYSPFVILFSWIFLGERLTPGDMVGAVLIILGIFITSSRRPMTDVSPSEFRRGVGLATLSVALMALGVILAKPVLDRSPVLWSTAVRLIAGLLALMALTAVSPKRRAVWRMFRPSSSWKVAIPAAVLGTYVAMLVWIAGMKYTQASTAAILNQTSAVFVLPMAAVVLKEAITARKIAAVVLAIAGVVLVTMR